MAQQTKQKRPVGRPTQNANGIKKQYGFVQLEREIYDECKEYTIEHGYRLGAFVGIAIKKYLKQLKGN